MCTVTYIPTSNGFFLTSNRDEKNTRSTAQSPAIYNYFDNKIIFPKDTNANGTWIVLKENGDALCLLNGAFANFVQKENYKKSRGKIVLEIASAHNIVSAFQYFELDSIAPFTLILIHNKLLYECRWDGVLKHFKKLNSTKPFIWSSTTLYNALETASREKWFERFLQKNSLITQEEIIAFHKNAGAGNKENNLVMQRENKYATVSITNIYVQQGFLQMQYLDLKSDTTSIANFENEFVSI